MFSGKSKKSFQPNNTIPNIKHGGWQHHKFAWVRREGSLVQQGLAHLHEQSMGIY